MELISMSKVYFKELEPDAGIEQISSAAAEVLARFIESEQISLENNVPLKVHFGEKGNQTYVSSEHYLGVIDYLRKNNVEASYIETNVLYAGKRSNRTDHLNTAKLHGFTQLPIIIADGEKGEDCTEVEINKKHFKKCFVGSEFSKFNQVIVMSHFKGHIMAGFGGAIKQLAMGFAAKAGKLAQHSNSKPLTLPLLCSKCGACIKYCPQNAMKMGLLRPKINKELCTGCAGCVTVCRRRAIIPNFLASFSKSFIERLAEYAYAAQLGKNIIYLTFAVNITRGCDCEGRKMKPFVPNLGILASTDAVAVDQVGLDLLDRKHGRKVFKRGRHVLAYAESIGLGSRDYEIISL
jgi:hypothetical protein